MRIRQLTAVLAVGVAAWPGPSVARAQDVQPYPLEARVWLDRGADPVLQRGERARIYYSVSESAFVAIFHIDTNGTVRMVFPSSPQENHYARGGRDYRVLFPGSTYWYAEDDPGVGYFFIVASPEPFDFRDFGYSNFAGGWDLGLVGRQVYGDPYLAMDDYVAALVPDWEYVGYGLDFTSYNVEQHYDYPRFLCYQCHSFQPYYSWNPYGYSCTNFRVVIYNDPYYYPATRYRGTRVVYVQPRRGIAQFGFKERAVGEPSTPQVVVRNTPVVSQPGVEGNGNRRAVPRTGVPSVFNPGSTGGSTPPAVGQTRPGVAGAANRRGGDGNTLAPLPGATQRPVLERRPSGAGTSATPSRPTQTTGSPPARPSVKVRPPGGGGGGVGSTAARGGGTATRSTPTVRTGGGSTGGTATRSTPTVRTGGGSTGGTATRSTPTVRTGGGSTGGTATRSTPTVRTGGGSTAVKVRPPGGGSPTARTGGTSVRTSPTVGGGGSPTRTTPTVRVGGSSSAAPPRTVKPRTVPKPTKPRGGGGG